MKQGHKNYFPIVFCAWLLCLFSAQAYAESNIREATLASDEFREGFEDKVNVAGGVLLGLALGPATGLTAIDYVQLDKSGLLSATSICIRATTSDGLFWSENLFVIDGGESLWRAKPISKDFSDELKSYGEENIVISAGLITPDEQTSCENTRQVYAPVGLSQNIKSSILSFYINSTNRYVEAGLWTLGAGEDDDPLVSAKCQEPSLQKSAIYDKVCQIDLSKMDKSGLFEFRIFLENPPFDVETWTETIALPSTIVGRAE